MPAQRGSHRHPTMSNTHGTETGLATIIDTLTVRVLGESPLTFDARLLGGQTALQSQQTMQTVVHIH